MSVFIDTSAFMALHSTTDIYNKSAEQRWMKLLNTGVECVTSNYIVLETSTLLQKRIGLDAVRVLHQEMLPAVTVHWVDDQIQRTALAVLFVSGRRALSLVDSTSFEVMRELGIHEVFTFDKHFKEFGFTIFS